MIIRGNTLEYWKNNAEEDYLKVPISVLKYITILEEILDIESIEVLEWVKDNCVETPSGWQINGREYTSKNLYEIFKRERSETVA